MKRLLLKAGVVGIIIAFVTISFSLAFQAAEMKKFVFSKKSVKNISIMNLNAPQDKLTRLPNGCGKILLLSIQIPTGSVQKLLFMGQRTG